MSHVSVHITWRMEPLLTLCSRINRTWSQQCNCVTVGSDHHAICFDLKCKIQQSLKHANFEHFNKLLSLAPWELFMGDCNSNIDASWNGFWICLSCSA